MSNTSPFREYWRIILLAILIIASTAVIVSPAQLSPGADADVSENGTVAEDDSLLNLKYGLELAGGTSVRAPLVGVSATNIDIARADRSNVSRTLVDELDVDSFDVRIRHGAPSEDRSASVEVYQEINPEELRTALEQTSVDTAEVQIRDDVVKATYTEAEETLRARIGQSGLSGGQVTQSVGAEGSRYLIVKVPNEDQQEVLALIEKRGLLRVVGAYPTRSEDGQANRERETIVTQADIHSVGQLNDDGRGVGVPITLTDAGGQRYVEFLESNGFLTEEGTGNCNLLSADARSSTGFCLITYQDNEFIHGGGIAEGLVNEMRNGNFENSPTVVLTSENRSDAQNLQATLRAGAMPSTVDLERGTVQYLSPSQANEFKVFSFLIGILTVLAVSMAVAYRYRDPAIAAPMTLTALSEVWLLLGFVAAVQLPLDLSHIAGLIAVVGTGVDDLIIIADEVLSGGDVSTQRVFESRFKKAFWVIGVAAITTIIAMSPLAILSLGDLQGFAIVTIAGVLIGVLVTRPAYGDILKWIVKYRNN